MTADASRRPQSIQFISSATKFWGAELSLLDLASEMLRSGHSVSLLCRSPELLAAWNRRVGGPSRLWSASSGRWGAVVGAAHSLRRSPAQITVLWSYDLALLSLFPHSLLRQRSLYLDLHDRLHGRRGQLIMRILSRRLSGIIANSEFASNYLPSSTVTVLYRPALTTDVPPPDGRDSLNQGDLKVGLVGRIEPIKNHMLLILATMELEGVTVSIRGAPDAESEDYYADLMRLAGCLAPGRVQFTGRVENDAVYEDLDVLCVTNSNEAMGRTVIEAGRRAIPSVVPNSGGSCELVEHGLTGLHFRADDVHSLRESIARLRDNSALRMDCGARSKLKFDGWTGESYASDYLMALSHVKAP